MTRKSKPWAVIVTRPDIQYRVEHTSQTKAYTQVNTERAAIANGSSNTTEIRVEQWQPAYNSWALYENAYPAE